MNTFDVRLTNVTVNEVGLERTKVVQISDFFKSPDEVCTAASSKTYARINPHYPGVRATVDPELLACLCQSVAELTTNLTNAPKRSWQGQAWYSIVTCPPERLAPIQRLPHFDGFDETQLAVMVYLNRTAHGGTGFFRQKTTGFERVTEARYPSYKNHLERNVRAMGLPSAQYISDGGPHFEQVADFGAAFNSMILYPGTALHSGLINNTEPLSSDPGSGRLTINGFFRPA